VQVLGGGVEAPQLYYCGERGELLAVEIHISDSNANTE
jgi:hypothetical protein